MKQLCIGLAMALVFSTVASAASRHHYRHYGHSYRAAPSSGAAPAARFQRHFDNN
jgi:hypothetical protein